jgi:hypothetical protein
MGFLGIISADKLEAFYETDTQTLTLRARGTIIEATYGFEFVRRPWAGGLKFVLEAWSGPLTGKSKPYDFSQKFQLSLSPWIKEVIIVDVGHSDGVPVPITFQGVVPGPPKSAQPPKSAPQAPDAQEQTNSVQDLLNVLYKEPFTISEQAELPKMGSVDLKFDPTFLTLQTAGISDGKIVWNFDSLQTGNTQVIVTVRGGIATFVKRVVYDVRIFVLPSSELGLVLLNGASKAQKDPSAILSYLGRVEIARRIVQEKYPNAALYHAAATTTTQDGVDSPYLLTQMQVMFRVEKGTVIINSTGYGTFGPAEFKEGSIVGNADLDWPVKFDAIEADNILKKQGYTGRYKKLGLVKPLYPGMDQDYYVFTMEDGRDVWIGTKDGKVVLK